MKHLKIYEKYTSKQQEILDDLNKTWYGYTVYNENGQNVASSIGENHKIENLINTYKAYKDDSRNNLIVMTEHTRRILSDQEIEQLSQTTKYNL